MPALASRATLPRPTDPDIIQRVTDAIRKGHPNRTASILAGLGPSTNTQWLAKGEDELAAWDGTGEAGRYAKYALAVKLAEAEMVEQQLGVIQEATERAWQPAAWLLERRLPDSYALQQRVQIEQRSVSVTWNLDSLPAAQQAAIAQAVLDAVSAPATSPVTPLLTAPQEQD